MFLSWISPNLLGKVQVPKVAYPSIQLDLFDARTVALQANESTTTCTWNRGNKAREKIRRWII